jgi:hypothetical protein
MSFDTQRTLVNLSITENKHFQSCHASRHNTRAGFDSAPLTTGFKLFRADYYLVRLLALSVTAIHINLRFFPPDKKTRAFERRRTMSQ